MRGSKSHGCLVPRGTAVGAIGVASKSAGLKENEWLIAARMVAMLKLP